MADQGKTSNSIYGDDHTKAMSTTPRQTHDNTARPGSLSTQAPFTTDNDSIGNMSASPSSQSYGANPFASFATDLRFQHQDRQLSDADLGDFAQNVFGGGASHGYGQDNNLVEHSPAKRCRLEFLSSQNDALGPESSVSGQQLSQQPLHQVRWVGTAPAPAPYNTANADRSISATLPSETDVCDNDSQVESEEESATERAEFLFRIDVQRCEGFLHALEASLRVCKDNGRVEAVRLMARKLEKMIDAMNRS